MSDEELLEIIKRKWDSQGECRSCGWHGCLSEYSQEITFKDIVHSDAGDYIYLPCLDDPNHRGVYIYIDQPKE